MTISTNPPKWTADRYPEEFRIRKYIFDTWRRVCSWFGYQEYLGPLVEDAAIWEAKSGEDVWGSELTKITNRDGQISNLALRPEMTPTVTRMITNKYRELPKPIRRYSIANFYRNERPQRGRNREFRQLNVDCFWSESRNADLEILLMAIELMLAFWASSDQFVIYLNHRSIIDQFLWSIWIDSSDKQWVMRLMDKRDKLQTDKMHALLVEQWLSEDQCTTLTTYMQHEAGELAWYELIDPLMQGIKNAWYEDMIAFKPSLMRWFDYYDGMVFEVFDKHPDNNRALFGGGRYNGLAEIFWSKTPIPAVGFAPGDEPMRLFLEAHDLLPEPLPISRYYLPLLSEDTYSHLQAISTELRMAWHISQIWLDPQTLTKALESANKHNCTHMVILGEEELEKKAYYIKNMITWEQESVDFA